MADVQMVPAILGSQHGSRNSSLPSSREGKTPLPTQSGKSRYAATTSRQCRHDKRSQEATPLPTSRLSRRQKSLVSSSCPSLPTSQGSSFLPPISARVGFPTKRHRTLAKMNKLRPEFPSPGQVMLTQLREGLPPLITEAQKAYLETDTKDEDFETDLELDCDDRTVPHDDNEFSRQLYTNECRKLRVAPSSFLLRNLEEDKLRMKYHNMGPKRAQALTVPLGRNMTITSVDLEENYMLPRGAKHFAFLLTENDHITELNLAENHLGSLGLWQLHQALAKNTSLRKLNLSGNQLNDHDAQTLVVILENNFVLHELDLSHNQLGYMFGCVFGKVLVDNDSLQVLDLSWNHLRLRGAEELAKGLRKNTAVVTLTLDMNGLSNNGAKAMAQALIANKTLEELSMTSNRINAQGAVDFSRCFNRNRTLKTLRLGKNPLTPEGCLNLLKTLAGARRSRIQLLDLEDMVVGEEFIEVAQSLVTTRRGKFRFNVGKVVAGEEAIGAYEKMMELNPLEILLIYMKQQNLRLVDLFHTLDQDKSMSLTKDEFVKGLKDFDTPLSESQVERLIDMLDQDGDGQIDLVELMSINTDFRNIKKRAFQRVKEWRDRARQRLAEKKRIEKEDAAASSTWGTRENTEVQGASKEREVVSSTWGTRENTEVQGTSKERDVASAATSAWENDLRDTDGEGGDKKGEQQKVSRGSGKEGSGLWGSGGKGGFADGTVGDSREGSFREADVTKYDTETTDFSEEEARRQKIEKHRNGILRVLGAQ